MIGVTDEVWGESIVAIVIPADPAKPPPQEDLRQFVRQHLAPYKTPQHWYLASALPANSMGKIQNYLLRAQVRSGSLPELP